MITTILLAWIITLDTVPWTLITATTALATISFCDDLKPLPARWRFLAQCIAVVLGMSTLENALLFNGALPTWLDYTATALLWLWFINLFNFMDGIDGISGVETISIGGGLLLLATFRGMPDATMLHIIPETYTFQGGIIAAAALGFLLWNWHPAKVFLGDVGSIPLGFLLGYVLLNTALSGAWVAALLLPAYYLCDASWTLLRRALRGKKVWQAHSEHWYQQAVRAGKTHSQVTLTIAGLNIALITLVAATTLELWSPLLTLGTAALFIAATAAWLTK